MRISNNRVLEDTLHVNSDVTGHNEIISELPPSTDENFCEDEAPLCLFLYGVRCLDFAMF